MQTVKITGIAELLKNLDKHEDQVARGVEKGLTLAGIHLQGVSQKLVPVDTGNLKGSAFTRKDSATSGFKTAVYVGYTAYYALFVHECPMINPGKPRKSGNGVYWDPRPIAQNKFLETPVRDPLVLKALNNIVTATIKRS